MLIKIFLNTNTFGGFYSFKNYTQFKIKPNSVTMAWVYFGKHHDILCVMTMTLNMAMTLAKPVTMSMTMTIHMTMIIQRIKLKLKSNSSTNKNNKFSIEKVWLVLVCSLLLLSRFLSHFFLLNLLDRLWSGAGGLWVILGGRKGSKLFWQLNIKKCNPSGDLF